MEIKINKESNATFLLLSGEVDAVSALQLDDSIKKVLSENPKNILVDCQGLTYISSAGLGVFMSYIKDLKANDQKMILFNLTETVFSTFEILGLNHIITIVKTKEEARALC
jgi:anti-sigma B factor antagonist